MQGLSEVDLGNAIMLYPQPYRGESIIKGGDFITLQWLNSNKEAMVLLGPATIGNHMKDERFIESVTESFGFWVGLALLELDIPEATKTWVKQAIRKSARELAASEMGKGIRIQKASQELLVGASSEDDKNLEYLMWALNELYGAYE